MKDIRQAARDLVAYLDSPPWLTTIVAGWEDDRPAIILYLASNPATPVQVLQDGNWEGYPVVARFFGHYAPMGSC